MENRKRDLVAEKKLSGSCKCHMDTGEDEGSVIPSVKGLEEVDKAGMEGVELEVAAEK